jgi:hypothetical protein
MRPWVRWSSRYHHSRSRFWSCDSRACTLLFLLSGYAGMLSTSCVNGDYFFLTTAHCGHRRLGVRQLLPAAPLPAPRLGALRRSTIQASRASSAAACGAPFADRLRRESPGQAILDAWWTSRSRSASASVGSPSASCQCSTGSGLVTLVARRSWRSSSSSSRSRRFSSLRSYAAFLTRSSAGNGTCRPLRMRRCFNFRHETP